MSRKNRSNGRSQQTGNQNRKERRNKEFGGRNKEKVVNSRWEKKESSGRIVRDEEHSYVKPHVEPMNQVQAEFLSAISNKSCVVFRAPAGCGKSFLAMSEVADWIKEGVFNKVYLTRPTVGMGKNTIGNLPGSERDKYEPYLLPLVDIIRERYGVGFYETGLSNGTIEFIVPEYLRGRNFSDVVILDEGQNTTPEDMYTYITRISEGGLLIILGDSTQTDIRGQNGIDWLIEFTKKNPELKEYVEVVEATSDDIVRGGLCKMMVKAKESSGGLY